MHFVQLMFLYRSWTTYCRARYSVARQWWAVHCASTTAVWMFTRNTAFCISGQWERGLLHNSWTSSHLHFTLNIVGIWAARSDEIQNFVLIIQTIDSTHMPLSHAYYLALPISHTCWVWVLAIHMLTFWLRKHELCVEYHVNWCRELLLQERGFGIGLEHSLLAHTQNTNSLLLLINTYYSLLPRVAKRCVDHLVVVMKASSTADE